MDRTIIHGARIGGSAYRYQISILLRRGGGAKAKWRGAAGFTATLCNFSGEDPAGLFFFIKYQKIW